MLKMKQKLEVEGLFIAAIMYRSNINMTRSMMCHFF